MSSNGKSLTRKVMEFLEAYPGSRPSDIANALGVSRAIVYKVLSYLKARGLVKKVGNGYVLTKSIPSEHRLEEEAREEARASSEERILAVSGAASRVRGEVLNRVEEVRREVASVEEKLRSVAKAVEAIAEWISAISKRGTGQGRSDVSELLKIVKIVDLDTATLLLKLSRDRDACSEFVVMGYLAVRKSFLEELRSSGGYSEFERLLVKGFEVGEYEDLCLYV